MNTAINKSNMHTAIDKGFPAFGKSVKILSVRLLFISRITGIKTMGIKSHAATDAAI